MCTLTTPPAGSGFLGPLVGGGLVLVGELLPVGVVLVLVVLDAVAVDDGPPQTAASRPEFRTGGRWCRPRPTDPRGAGLQLWIVAHARRSL